MPAILEHVARRPAAAPPGPRLFLWLLITLLHAMLVVWLQGAVSVPMRPPAVPAAPVTRLRLLVLPPPPVARAEPSPPAATVTPTPRPAPAHRPVAPARLALEPASPAQALNMPDAPAAPKAPAAALPAGEPGLASNPPATPGSDSPAATAPLLDSDGTRRAVRQIASERGTAARARAERGEEDQPSPSERLGQAVQRTALGDCLRGDYAGAGMGLLSIPAFAVAQLRGRCANGTAPAQPAPTGAPAPPGRAPAVRP